MPTMLKKPCAHPGCPEVVSGDRCEAHKIEKRKQYDQARNKEWQHLYNARWRRERSAYLMSHPLCAHCLAVGRVTAAVILDHVIPHKGNVKLFWDKSNRQGLCAKCHNVKTYQEGAFGK